MLLTIDVGSNKIRTYVVTENDLRRAVTRKMLGLDTPVTLKKVKVLPHHRQYSASHLTRIFRLKLRDSQLYLEVAN